MGYGCAHGPNVRVMSTTSVVPTLELNDHFLIPQLGFGTWQIDPKDAQGVVEHALSVGYTHVDTAQMYGNEAEVGAAIKASGTDRRDVFLTTKLNNGFHRPDDAREAFEDSLKKLGTDYVDLFLIHWPLPTKYDGDFVSTWKVLEEFKHDGRARSIGVSNFQVAHLEALAAAGTQVPAVNQIEHHPYFANEAVRAYGEEHGIITEAWSPLAQGKVPDEPVAKEIGEQYGKTPSQVVLRWHLQHGHVIFPKSTTPSRIEENFDLFDFELTADDVARLDGLDQGAEGRIGPDPDTFDFIPS
jgi:2,5-diketo-D-gluconate reductase A